MASVSEVSYLVIANDKLQMSSLHCELLIGILYFVYFRNRSSNHKICTFFKVWIQRLGGKCVDVKDIAGGLLSAVVNIVVSCCQSAKSD